MIGRGDVDLEVNVVEQLLDVAGELTIYNGPRGDAGRILIGNLVVPAPVTAEIGIPILVRKIDKGRFTWRATAAIPKIAGGYGSITGYSVRIGKRFLTATCASGRLRLRVVSRFADGTKLSEGALRSYAMPEADVGQ